MGLDGVELALAVEDTFGISIPDSVAFEMTTPAMMISFVQQAVSARPEREACISQRAFHKVRASLMKTTGAGRRDVTLKTPIRRLFSGPQSTDQWRDFKDHAGLLSLPNLGFGTGWLFGPTSVNDLVSSLVLEMANDLKDDRSWTNEEVREIVRRIISNQLAVEKFKDTDEFVRDLGLD